MFLGTKWHKRPSYFSQQLGQVMNYNFIVVLIVITIKSHKESIFTSSFLGQVSFPFLFGYIYHFFYPWIIEHRRNMNSLERNHLFYTLRIIEWDSCQLVSTHQVTLYILLWSYFLLFLVTVIWYGHYLYFKDKKRKSSEKY